MSGSRSASIVLIGCSATRLLYVQDALIACGVPSASTRASLPPAVVRHNTPSTAPLGQSQRGALLHSYHALSTQHPTRLALSLPITDRHARH
jgi:hypothetical protein